MVGKVCSCIITAAFCLILVTGMEVLLKHILTIFGTPSDIYQDAYRYLQIFIIGYFALFLYMQMTAILRSFGDAMFQMIGMLAGTILNAVIDPIFIHFSGIAGAAWATTFSQILCLVLAIVYAMKKAYFKVDIRLISGKLAGSVVKNAVPSCIQQSIPAVSSMIIVILVNRFDVTTIAAYGVVKMIENILFYPAMAMNMGLMTIVGQCVGAGRDDRTKDYIKTACLYGGVIEVVLTAVVLIFSKGIARAFVNEAAVGTIVSHALLIIGAGYLCYMITNIFMAKLSGMGKPNLSMILMFVYYIVIRVPLAMELMKTSLGLNGIWVAILFSHLLAAVLGIIMVHLTERRYTQVCNE